MVTPALGVPEDVYRRATIETVEDASRLSKAIGFPAMIKASEGGGGKGIRKVLSEEELASAFRQVQGEVLDHPSS